MANEMCMADNAPSIFVLKDEHVEVLRNVVTDSDKVCVHTYENGFLVYIKDYSLWTLSWLFLESRRIFHQKFQ